MHIFLKNTWNILQENHIVWHKTGLNKSKMMEIISRIFSEHNYMKLEIKHIKINEKTIYHMDTKQHATTNSMGLCLKMTESVDMHAFLSTDASGLHLEMQQFSQNTG